MFMRTNPEVLVQLIFILVKSIGLLKPQGSTLCLQIQSFSFRCQTNLVRGGWGGGGLGLGLITSQYSNVHHSMISGSVQLLASLGGFDRIIIPFAEVCCFSCILFLEDVATDEITAVILCRVCFGQSHCLRLFT